jgi:hypothetical protein
LNFFFPGNGMKKLGATLLCVCRYTLKIILFFRLLINAGPI